MERKEEFDNDGGIFEEWFDSTRLLQWDESLCSKDLVSRCCSDAFGAREGGVTALVEGSFKARNYSMSAVLENHAPFLHSR